MREQVELATMKPRQESILVIWLLASFKQLAMSSLISLSVIALGLVN
jgi:hypothetical protein